MQFAMIGTGIGLLVAALVFMVRADIIGFVGGGVIGAIGLLLLLVGIFKDG